MKPGLYNMVRSTDQTGVSGTGRVAQMAIFEDGSAVVRWMTGRDSTVCWAKWQDAVDVHINAHPDSTKLVAVGADPCAESALAADKQKNMKDSERWATLRQEAKTLSQTIYDYCADRQIRCEEHNSHGLYFDAWVGGKKFMLDCSPEDQKRPYPKGLVVIRDASHHYSNPTRVGAANMLSAEGQALMDDILGVQPA